MRIEQPDMAFHRRQLQAWFADYQTDRDLREPVAPVPIPHPGADRAAADDTFPAAGQVRLLAPSTASLPELERPIFVLLLAAQADAAFSVIPFSRYPLPATPQEWRTGLRKRPLRVLCLWNRQRCTASHLQASWLVATLPQAKQTEVTGLVRRLNGMHDYASRRFGPPLVHPFDPRHAYLQEERILLQDLLAASGATHTDIIEYPTPESRVQNLLAAEPPGEYGSDAD